ncbi:HAMP domain-containing sensor histidine kinase [Streptomyces sp. SL13]|uniref:histidine kinase n=1 Tax=Streptantibioticus silvisoli TaxID=2705255 RepID=A0AA90KAM7_9ACTN|nr:HAMP domain-containing sensor histidine kinase [Streptantibioticus silvisoli]MDI5972613.1 HAMP domain-containing sensor histidine kinase [Streptantibioticus silvisoli]
MIRRPGAAPDAEHRELLRTRRVLGLRLSLVLTLVLLIIGVVVYAVMTASQNADVDRDLGYAATRSGVGSPPGCAWLVLDDSGATRRSPGLPAGFPLTAPIRAVAAGGPATLRDVVVHHHRYRVLTRRRGDGTVQAVYDERFEQRDRDTLLLALGATELLGLAGAVAAAGLLAQHAMRPLTLALVRRRRFVADASHELRTPVTRLHTRAQLLARRAQDDVAGERMITEVTRLVAGTRQLGEVIDDLLLSTRMRVEPAEFAAVDLAVLADQACAEENAAAARTGLAFTVVRERGPYVVAGVETAIRRVVTALVDNAVGHTPPGGRVTLTVGAGPGGTVRLTVADDGVGLDPREADRLFERHAHGTAGRGPRFGIGLSLVREIVDSHHGTVGADGLPGRGARFTVTLPAWRTGTARRGRRVPRRAPARRTLR